MKLNKIKKIKGYKSFQDFSWQPFLNNEAFHDEVNILYGENGSGKSSIVNILKNVLDGDDLFNKNFGYKGFGKHKPQEASLVFDCVEYNYKRKEFGDPGSTNNENIFGGNFWDKKLSSHDAILFFDREFVAKNVHEYERKTTKDGQEQQSGKLIIEFDSDAINLRETRDKAKKAKDEQEQKMKDFNSANKFIFAFNLSEDEKVLYQSLKDKSEDEIKTVKQELDKEKDETKKSLETDQGRQKKVFSIQSDMKSLPINEVQFSLSGFETYQAIFDFDLKEQTKIEVEQALIDKVKTRKTFFEAGFEIRKTHQNQCPFCQSENEENSIKKIINLYEQIYDTTYKIQVQKFEKNKQTFLNELSQITQSLSDFDLNTIFLELKRLDESYKILNIYSVDDEKTCKKPAVREIKELSDKIVNLAKPNKENIQEIYAKVKSEYDEIEVFFKAVGDFVDQKNKLIIKFKADNTDKILQARMALSTKRISEIDKELRFFNGNMIAGQKNKEEKDGELKTIRSKFDISDENYKEAKKEYEKYCASDLFRKPLVRMQDYFKKFNPFRV